MVIVKSFGQMIGAKPFAVIFDEIGGVEPLARRIALPAAAELPPFAAIFEIDGAKRLDILFEHLILILIGENGDEGFGIAVAALIVRAENRVIGVTIVTPFLG